MTAPQSPGRASQIQRALALDIDELFQQAVDSPASQDAAAVGALLHAAGRGGPSVCSLRPPDGRSTGSPPRSTRSTPSVGLRLHRFGEDQVRITAAVATPDTLQNLLRSSMARTGMNLRQARML